MTGVLDKIRKRMAYPVTLPNGEVITIRSLSMGEQVRSGAIVDGDARIGFLVGCVLAEDDGTAAYSKVTNESDAEFGMRVASECDLDTPSFQAIQSALEKLNKVPSQDIIIKNSDETSTQT